MVNQHSINVTNTTTTTATLKFLCSYGGKILPRQIDGKLRYHGGHTRVLSVDRSVSFAELLVKLGEMCGSSVNLRCKLPFEDLDALVSITSDEDLSNLIEEYDRLSSLLKIRAFLSERKSIKRISPPQSISQSPLQNVDKCYRTPVTSSPPPVMSPVARQLNKTGLLGKIVHPHPHPHLHHQYPYYAHGNPNYLVHNGNYWQ